MTTTGTPHEIRLAGAASSTADRGGGRLHSLNVQPGARVAVAVDETRHSADQSPRKDPR